MLQWPDATLHQGIADVCDQDPERTALLSDGDETTHGELLKEARTLADGLSSLGVEPGDCVAVWLGNRPSWVTAQLAASHVGAMLVAVNTRYRTHELEYMLKDSQCVALITEESFLGQRLLGDARRRRAGGPRGQPQERGVAGDGYRAGTPR